MFASNADAENDCISHKKNSPLSVPSPAPISPCSVLFAVETQSPYSASSRQDYAARIQHDSNLSSLEILSMDTSESSLSYIFNLASPTDTLSSISAEAPTSPGESLGFSKECAKAFSDGTLLPYVLSLLSTSPPLAAIQHEKTTWNGHLPLDPYDAHANEEWATPRRRRRQRQPPPYSKRDLSPHVIFPTTISDPHQVEILFHSCTLVCFSCLGILYFDAVIRNLSPLFLQSCTYSHYSFSLHVII